MKLLTLPTSLILTTALAVFGCDKCSKSADETAEEEDLSLSEPQDPNVPAEADTGAGGIHERADVKQAATTGQLEKIELNEGSGNPTQVGQTVFVHYEGYLLNGKKFDSSRDRNQEFPVTLGRGQVIAGWEEGLVGMKVGGKRILVIPPEKGYGAAGAGDVIPPNSVLLFEVELMRVQ